MEKYSVIDLFAGAGGLSYGFLQTGRFQVVAAAEINENARKTYKKNIAADVPQFQFIDNVVGCDFKALSEQLGGIDIVSPLKYELCILYNRNVHLLASAAHLIGPDA